ncbi:MAG: helix-turn-helix transcriptional regulator [Limisphaerales bacterium]
MPKVQSDVYCRPPWQRMMRMHELLRKGRHPNCRSFAEEFEISTRTAKRDVDFMKCRLNLPIEYDPRRNGYCYSRPVEHLPAVSITEGEMFALLVAHKAITQYQGTPFHEPLQAAFRKLTGQLDGGPGFTVGNLDEVLSFRPFAPEDTHLEAFEVITRALRDSVGLTFLYRNFGARRARRRWAHPYHLACINNQWYLFAFDVHRQALRTFVLTRLRQPEITGQKFVKPRDFDLGKYLRGSFNVYTGRGDHDVVLDFDSWAAESIRGRHWHASQHLTELPERGLRLQMRLTSLKEAERWVLSWGAHVTVIKPKALAVRLREMALDVRLHYTRTGGVRPARKR